jgi:hypothetical protein|tara:strand:- start:600 stop:1322 length:723 start_codon:yes stop_codon:yes gene_type:complete
MPLPTISTPTYELTLPSSGKKIKYRPFLVREEKVLIMALESEDTKQITNSVIDILNSCILSKGIKLETLATFDIEYLFLNIRSKSVGETIDVNIVCPDDNKTQVAVTVDVDSIKIKKDRKHKNVIKLDDNLSLKLKYPSMSQFIDSNFESKIDESEVKSTLDMIISCIDVIFNEEESWPASESTPKELEDFVDQLNTKQFKLIEDFFATMPKLTHTIKVKNPNTGVESEVRLEGLAAFFN